MFLFVDTEFSSFDSPKLLSLGLVDELEQSFYFELNETTVSKIECSDFVKEQVLPLFDKRGIVGKELDLKHHLNHFLNQYETIELACDYIQDYLLLVPFLERQNIEKMTVINVAALSNCFNEVSQNIQEQNNLIPHHALDDALALKKTYFQVHQNFSKRYYPEMKLLDMGIQKINKT